jgi:hypothetical protein
MTGYLGANLATEIKNLKNRLSLPKTLGDDRPASRALGCLLKSTSSMFFDEVPNSRGTGIVAEPVSCTTLST